MCVTILHKTKCGVLYLFSSFMLYRKAVILVICFRCWRCHDGWRFICCELQKWRFFFFFLIYYSPEGFWLLHPLMPAVNLLNLMLVTMLQTVFENTLMEHHVALPPGSMGKISYIAPAGQYSLQVSRYHTKAYCFSASLPVHFTQFYLTPFSLFL